MTKYRAFIKANIYPQDKAYNTDESFTIHIPEHTTYDTKQKAVTSKTRWDYSFGLNNTEVVILIRHITVVDDTYEEIRSMPEFCYDYDTFVKLGGWIEYVTRTKNAVNIDRVNKNFNDLYPNLLNDNITQIHIEPIDTMVFPCYEQKNIQIPAPIFYIAQNTPYSTGNCNCNRPLVDESFFKALSAFNTNDIKGKHCHITDNYLSVYDKDDNDGISGDIMYDVRMQRVVNADKWAENCYEYTIKQKREQKKALEKHGLFDAYNSLKLYLCNHHSIRKIDSDVNENGEFIYKVVKVNLAYGYKLSGFEILKNAIVWEITTYERAIKQDDCIRGMDNCYLIFKNGKTAEAAETIEYQHIINRVKNIMGFANNLHIYDIPEIKENYIPFESQNEDSDKDDYDLVAELIAADEYDITGFQLLEIPHPKVFCFGNPDENKYFDVVKFFDDKWQFSYIENSNNKSAHSIREAIEKYEMP